MAKGEEIIKKHDLGGSAPSQCGRAVALRDRFTGREGSLRFLFMIPGG